MVEYSSGMNSTITHRLGAIYPIRLDGRK